MAFSFHVSQGSGTKGMFDGITDASMDSEMGLPVLLATVLPVGLMGLMLSSYFSYFLPPIVV
jgi:SSS family solute:Na+ symporter